MELQYQFEYGTIPLVSGEVFNPEENAVGRWELVIPCSYRAAGSNVELLYQTVDDQFIIVTAHIGPRGWDFEEIKSAQLMSHAKARAWLLEDNFPLPDCLMKGMKTFPAVPKKKPMVSESANESKPRTEPPAVNIANWEDGAAAFASIQAKGNTPAGAHAPTSTKSGSTYTIAAVLEMAGVSDTTLNHYAKLAGIKTPQRGKRNHRYSADEVRAMLQALIDNTSDRAMKDRCRKALDGL